MFLLIFSLFIEFLSLNPNAENLRDLDAKNNVVLLLLYNNQNRNSKEIFNDYIQKLFQNSNQNGYIFRSVNCDEYPGFCRRYSYDYPSVIQYFDMKNAFCPFHYHVSNNENEWKSFLVDIKKPKAIGYSTEQFSTDTETLSGGSTFHLFVKNGDDPILERYKALANVYYAFKCHFYYTISPKVNSPSLSVFRSKSCMNIVKGAALKTNLVEIIDSNKFSHFHKFEDDEFDDIVDINNKSVLVFLSSTPSIEKNDIQGLLSLSNAICSVYQMGWTYRHNTKIGEKLRSHNSYQEVIIVNRVTDCLFLMPWSYGTSVLLRYTRSSFTATECWRYPEDSTKEVTFSYKRLLILLCIMITFLYFSIIYIIKKPILPIRS